MWRHSDGAKAWLQLTSCTSRISKSWIWTCNKNYNGWGETMQLKHKKVTKTGCKKHFGEELVLHIAG